MHHNRISNKFPDPSLVLANIFDEYSDKFYFRLGFLQHSAFEGPL